MSDAPSRQLLHSRQVECRGYLRSDGLFEIEGHLLDSKPREYTLSFKTIAAGEPLHQMWLRLVVDGSLLIHHCEAVTEDAPTPFCSEINGAYAALAGLRIGPGFKKRVLQRLGGERGCTHLTELLGPLATTAVQTVSLSIQEDEQQITGGEQINPHQWVVGGCHVYRADGEAVRMLEPRKVGEKGDIPLEPRD